jgi:hypothetical protein
MIRIRSLGIALLLASAGAALCAQSFITDFAIGSCPVLPPESDGATYGVINLFDGKADTAWCPASPDSAWFVVDFGEPRDVNMFYIRNGYQRKTAKGTDLFAANARVKRLKLVNDRGESQILDLDDSRTEIQFFVSSSASFGRGVKSIRFTVLSTYPGAKYQDVLLSELRLRWADTSEDEMVKGG